jgi:hypothetical protein
MRPDNQSQRGRRVCSFLGFFFWRFFFLAQYGRQADIVPGHRRLSALSFFSCPHSDSFSSSSSSSSSSFSSPLILPHFSLLICILNLIVQRVLYGPGADAPIFPILHSTFVAHWGLRCLPTLVLPNPQHQPPIPMPTYAIAIV